MRVAFFYVLNLDKFMKIYNQYKRISFLTPKFKTSTLRFKTNAGRNKLVAGTFIQTSAEIKYSSNLSNGN